MDFSFGNSNSFGAVVKSKKLLEHVWERGCGCVPKKFEIFFIFTKI